MVGRKEKSSSGVVKYTVMDILLTPNPDETGAGVEKTSAAAPPSKRAKNLLELLGTSFDGFKYSDWVAEFNLTVEKMLGQGLQCIGLYTWCENEQVQRLAYRKTEALLMKMHLHFKESKIRVNEFDDGAQLAQTEEQKAMQRLSDDEEGEETPFDDFLVLSHCKS